MKHKVWTVACGGYKSAGARVFPTRKEAEDYMKAEYEDQIQVSEIEDTSMCYIDDEYAEPYSENMDFDEVFVFQLEEHEIDLPDQPVSDEETTDTLKTYQLLREDAKYGTDISLTFMAKNHEEAKRYVHALALKTLQNDYNDHPNANWDDAWVSLYAGSYENEYGVVAGIDLDNISNTLNYNIIYTLHELDGLTTCDTIAQLTEEEAEMLNLAYKIETDGIFEDDMKKVFKMLKDGLTIHEVKTKMEPTLKD